MPHKKGFGPGKRRLDRKNPNMGQVFVGNRFFSWVYDELTQFISIRNSVHEEIAKIKLKYDYSLDREYMVDCVIARIKEKFEID